MGSSVLIDGLGLWDQGADGIGPSTPVGLWNSTGTLLTSVVVTNGSTPTASLNASGQWLFETITPMTLAAGTYFVGAAQLEASPSVAVLVTPVLDPRITALTGASGPSNAGLAFPGDFYPFDVYGPNLRTAEVAAPEPGSLALMAAGVIAFASTRRARRR